MVEAAHILERWRLAVKHKTTSKLMAAMNIDQHSEASIRESFRRLVIRQAISDTRTEARKHKTVPMAMMLSTTADEPDHEHALLEGEVMPKVELLQYLQRFGCQHAYKDIN